MLVAAYMGSCWWKSPSGVVWMSDKGRALFGVVPDTRLDYAALTARVHPEDRAARDAAVSRHPSIIVETCRRLNIPVRDYLGSVLPSLANMPINRIGELTPIAWAKFLGAFSGGKPRAQR